MTTDEQLPFADDEPLLLDDLPPGMIAVEDSKTGGGAGHRPGSKFSRPTIRGVRKFIDQRSVCEPLQVRTKQ